MGFRNYSNAGEAQRNAHLSTLNMAAANSSEILVSVYQTIRRYISEGSSLESR